MPVLLTNNRIKIFCTFFFFLITLVLGSLVTLNGFGLRYFFRAYIIVPFIVFFFLWIMSERKEPVIESSIDVLYLLYCSFTLISGLWNCDVHTIASASIGVIIFFMIKSLTYEVFNRVYILFACSYAISILIIFCRYTIEAINSEGVLFSSLGIILLNVICKKKIESYIVYFLISAVIIFLIMATRARTPLAAFIVVDVITYFYLFASNFSLKKSLILISAVIAVFFLSDHIVESLDTYFFHKWGNSDLTSGRQEYWKIVMSTVSLFGYGMGEGSFINTLNINAHNTWAQVFGNFGIITGFINLLMTITILLKIRLAKSKIIFINFFVGWIILSTFEDLSLFSSRYIPITIAFLIHLFLLSEESSKAKPYQLNLLVQNNKM